MVGVVGDEDELYFGVDGFGEFFLEEDDDFLCFEVFFLE